jgi:oligopeptide transport system substrate-binding protein
VVPIEAKFAKKCPSQVVEFTIVDSICTIFCKEERIMRSKLFGLFALLVVASMVLAACGTPATVEVVKTVVVEKEGQQVVVTATPEVVAKPAVLRINLGTYPDIIDPQKSSFVNEIAHLKLMYEGLTRLNGKLETVPGAAEKWEYNADATELTFTLRAGLKYSDGSVLNAKRFEYSILRNINPETLGEYAGITDEIIGANAWRTASAEDLAANGDALKAAVEVHALDAAGAPCADYEQADCLTLKLKFGAPAPYFHTVMSLWVTYPAKEELIDEGGDIWWNSSKFQIGNGAFVLSALEPFVRAYFTPNANYWRGVATYDIEYRYINDGAVAFEAYKNNEFDLIGPGAEDITTAKADPVLSTELNQYPGSCTYALMFHQLKEPFTDQKVREAFAYALDRESWVTDVLKGNGSSTLTWIPKGFPGYDETENRWGFDAAKAQEALAASSYATVDKLPEITATFGDTTRNRTRWEWLTAKWKEVLGVDIKLNPVEPTAFTALTKDINTAPQMFILGWCADYPDPQNWLSVYWKTGAFGERIGYSNPDLDAMLAEADSTTDPAKRMQLYADAQKLLTDGAPVAFMWNNINSYLWKPWVKGVETTPMDSGWAGDNDPLTITIDTTLIP